MRRFDGCSLYEALDRQRRQRQLSWTVEARQTGVSVSTLRWAEQGRRTEVDGMLAMVGWLDEVVETFVKDTDW
ncbi:MAG: hypothetical protein AAF529_17135 [Pseudomonadota bacterium]